MYFTNVLLAVVCALIICTNVANSVPTFSVRSPTTVNVPETVTLLKVVTDKVTATGSGTVRYSLRKQTPWTLFYKFTVGESTGKVRVLLPLDYEDRKSYLLLIRATDDYGSTDRNLTIRVTDVDEPPVIDDIGPNFYIPDEAEIGTRVTRITATDPEGETIAYTIDHNNDFVIDGTTGVIKSTAVMNMTETSSYSLTVYASDGIISSELDITITVGNGASFLHGGYMALLMMMVLLILQ